MKVNRKDSMKLTEKAHQAWSQVVQLNDCCVDMTTGNGWDSLELSKLVGRQGKVYGFDIQEDAISNTQGLLSQGCKYQNFKLIRDCHTRFPVHLPRGLKGQIRAFTFNLGYLPGSDKSVITETLKSLQAMKEAYTWLTKDGIISVISYRGHHGGKDEFKGINQWIQQDSIEYHRIEASAKENSPVFFLIRKT